MFKFKNPQRQGTPLLKKFGYVEIGKFQPAVLHDHSAGGVKGYFCANCKYYMAKDGALYDATCTKLKGAEVALWGCCNAWEYLAAPKAVQPGGVDATAADATAGAVGAETPPEEQPVSEPAGQPVAQAPAQKKAVPAPVVQKPEPVQKPVPEPAKKTVPAPVQKPVQEPAQPTEPEPEEEPITNKRLKEVLRKTIKSAIIKMLKESKKKK